MSIKSPAEMAKEIRTAIKAKGIPARQVSVRSGYCGYSDYIHIDIKNGRINIKDIEAIARPYENVRIDEYTGETLMGANTYIRIKYDDHAFDDIIPENIDRAKKLLADISAVTDNTVIPAGDEIFLVKEHGNNNICLHDQKKFGRMHIYSPEQLAKSLYTLENYGVM